MAKLSVYKDLWVVMGYSDSDINEVYTTRDEAVLACDKKNEEIKQFRHLNTVYKVMTLNDGIELIKEYIIDEYSRGNDSSWASY